jgi:hypothetical protein
MNLGQVAFFKYLYFYVEKHTMYICWDTCLFYFYVRAVLGNNLLLMRIVVKCWIYFQSDFVVISHYFFCAD